MLPRYPYVTGPRMRGWIGREDFSVSSGGAGENDTGFCAGGAVDGCSADRTTSRGRLAMNSEDSLVRGDSSEMVNR